MSPARILSPVNRELQAAYTAGRDRVSWADFIASIGGEDLDFDGRPTEHGRALHQAWRDGDRDRRKDRRSEIAGMVADRGSDVVDMAGGARRAARAAARPVTEKARKARGALGSSSPLGLVVGMFALVLLYVLLTQAKAVSAAVSGVGGWLGRFMSPYEPLF